MNIESVKGVILVKYNFKHMICTEFHKYLLTKPDFHKKSDILHNFQKPGGQEDNR